MTKVIANPKNYTGDELSNIFFRPILTGDSAQQLGIRVLYNMPVPTTLNFWSTTPDILKSYQKGWGGAHNSAQSNKTLEMKKVKAEMSYSAADYFSMVYERMTTSPDINLTDLSGTELEAAETELFKTSIAEGLRATMWVGDTTRTSGFNTFDGFIKRIKEDSGTGVNDIKKIPMLPMTSATPDNGAKLLKNLLEAADPKLRALKSQANLVFIATRDIIENYEASLYNGTTDAAREARINGIPSLQYRGIPVVDMQVDAYLPSLTDLPQSFAILTDRRNLALAVNTRDLPGSEVAMWYNPDELENRQRATFLAAADYLLPELMVVSF